MGWFWYTSTRCDSYHPSLINRITTIWWNIHFFLGLYLVLFSFLSGGTWPKSHPSHKSLLNCLFLFAYPISLYSHIRHHPLPRNLLRPRAGLLKVKWHLKPFGHQLFEGWCHSIKLSFRFGSLANKGTNNIIVDS